MIQSSPYLVLDHFWGREIQKRWSRDLENDRSPVNCPWNNENKGKIEKIENDPMTLKFGTRPNSRTTNPKIILSRPGKWLVTCQLSIKQWEQKKQWQFWKWSNDHEIWYWTKFGREKSENDGLETRKWSDHPEVPAIDVYHKVWYMWYKVSMYHTFVVQIFSL